MRSAPDAPSDQDRGGAPPDAVRVERHRGLVRGLVGRKVSLSTQDQHYLVGRLLALEADDTLRILVNNREFLVRRAGVARIQEADPALAEYMK